MEELKNQREEKRQVVRIQSFGKRYRDKGPFAAKDISFQCYAGEIVGMIGHNGAGKSTTLKCMLGMLPATEGEIFIDGIRMDEKPILAKSKFGFVTDNHSVFLRMTGMQYLSFMADIYKVPDEKRAPKLAELEACFQLGDSIKNLISTYSHGMKQKICMMGSVIHEPLLWVMDEPMTGLDPRTSKAIIAYMSNYAKKGNCVLFSSHNLDAVTKICDRVLMIKNGRLTGDIVVQEFIAQNPDIDLEEYFLSDEE